jgi:Holliday junction resolvase RusA-like endonuclease
MGSHLGDMEAVPVNRLHITVRLVPPSVNHYKDTQILRSRKSGKHFLKWTVTPEAEIFKLEVRKAAGMLSVAPATLREQRKTTYRLRAVIYLGEGQRGDGDNFWKVIGDSLTFAGVIHSDAAVKDWHLYVRRDRENPRTEITVTRRTA